MRFSIKRVALAAILVLAAGCARQAGFTTIKDGHFVRDGRVQKFMGTNFWYGPIIASQGRGGDPERLTRELDALKELGLVNLRVLVGGDGPDGVFSRVDPALQTAPGVYNDTLLVGLDRLLVAMGSISNGRQGRKPLSPWWMATGLSCGR